MVLAAVLAGAFLAPTAGAFDLLQLYEETLASNPLLKGGEFSIDEAKAREDKAFSRLLPQLSASANVNWTAFSQDGSATFPAVSDQYLNTRAIIQARQALFDLPSWLRWEGAGSNVRQTQQELESSRMSVTADLIDRYFTVLESQDEMSYLQGEIALTEGDMHRIRSMFERQLAMVTDVFEVEAYYQTLLTRRIELENANAVALEKLRETAGIEVKDIVPLARERLPEVPGEAERWVKDAESGHPALLALQAAADAADKEADSMRAEHLPQLSLQLSDNYGNNAYDFRRVPNYNSGQVGVQVNLPIYAGGGIEAAAREAAARHRLILEKLANKRREIERETRTAYLNARTGRARLDSTFREVEARDKARAAQERSYELGVATIVALLESKKNLLKARFELARARYGYIRALVALRLWSGSLTQRDVEDINGWLAKARGHPPSSERPAENRPWRNSG
jgi:outer membrane protein